MQKGLINFLAAGVSIQIKLCHDSASLSLSAPKWGFDIYHLEQSLNSPSGRGVYRRPPKRDKNLNNSIVKMID